MFEKLKLILTLVNISTIILFVTMFMLVLILAKWHSDNSDFDFRKSLLDPYTGVISFSRLGHFVSLVTSTGLIMNESANGRMTEWLFIGYMTAWAGTYVASKQIEANRVKEDGK